MKKILSVIFACLIVSGIGATAIAQNVLEQFSVEPTIEQTQQAAVEHSGISSGRLENMYVRAGAANALPKSVSYNFRYKDQDQERKQTKEKIGSGDPIESTQYDTPTKFMQHDVKAQWDLSELVFNPDQIRVVKEMTSAAKQRDALLGNVTKIYFARRKAQVDLAMNPPANVADRIKQELVIQEHTANLDALTGGWFSAQLRQKGLKPY